MVVRTNYFWKQNYLRRTGCFQSNPVFLFWVIFFPYDFSMLPALHPGFSNLWRTPSDTSPTPIFAFSFPYFPTLPSSVKLPVGHLCYLCLWSPDTFQPRNPEDISRASKYSKNEYVSASMFCLLVIKRVLAGRSTYLLGSIMEHYIRLLFASN